jgi:hypothetical protein
VEVYSAEIVAVPSPIEAGVQLNVATPLVTVLAPAPLIATPSAKKAIVPGAVLGVSVAVRVIADPTVTDGAALTTTATVSGLTVKPSPEALVAGFRTPDFPRYLAHIV